MKRRTLEHLRPKRQPEQHHNVYVALLNASVSKTEKFVPRTRVVIARSRASTELCAGMRALFESRDSLPDSDKFQHNGNDDCHSDDIKDIHI